MRDKVNLAETLATFDEPFSPRIVGHYNGNKLQVAKTRGKLVSDLYPHKNLETLVRGFALIPAAERQAPLGGPWCACAG